jgi:hypothetical protein
MNKFLALAAISLFAMVSQANQETLGLSGVITCKGPNFTVSLSADRKTLVILKSGKSPEIYNNMEETVGDTDTWYSPKGKSAPTLNFGDSTDFFMFNSQQNGVNVKCPQGKVDAE